MILRVDGILKAGISCGKGSFQPLNLMPLVINNLQCHQTCDLLATMASSSQSLSLISSLVNHVFFDI